MKLWTLTCFNISTNDVTYCATWCFFLQLTSGRLLLPTDFLTLRLLEIHSLKWYFAPFSKCNLCLHPKLSLLNTLDHARWTRNDWDKVQFWSNIFLKYVENISIFTHAHSWKYWFSTYLMKYIWHSPKNVNIPYILYGLQKNVFMFMAYRCACRHISLYDIFKGTPLLGPT